MSFLQESFSLCTNHSYRQVPCPAVDSQYRMISSEKFWRFCCCYLVGWFCLLGCCCCCCLVFWAGFEVFLSHNTLSGLFSFIFSLSYRSFAIYYGFQFFVGLWNLCLPINKDLYLYVSLYLYVYFGLFL